MKIKKWQIYGKWLKQVAISQSQNTTLDSQLRF